ncbi:DNA topoisomerase 3-alpha [Micractinium conductrix]|uniref:DNA topoisomerase n=1 Tax=Micractinium conductrix TaxID=554055 RepID=A0A2P6UZN7_9CHLO|nr:DNA topoisomerase 3-alpha [Micractinium conductrix]|eukprot:PSC67305.1 DNA topoisomerase 3-alpha [Micractinium conductrix]
MPGVGQVEMVFTSVAGHLLELEFEPRVRSWHSCSPKDLYDATVNKAAPKGENEKIKRNLQQLARTCQWLVLWLDCDREGENIAFEVIQVCTEVNPRLTIRRARFSALVFADVSRALANLVLPNEAESAAVDARQEIDLRIGASFTRLQTLLLQNKFQWGEYANAEGRVLLSYGPCQFPTLGLIVQRAWEIQAHVSEPFWYIYVSHRQDGKLCEFKWHRTRLYDQASAALLHELCAEAPTATVTAVEGASKSRWAPTPLSTLEMQKRGSQYLRMPGERIMKHAEELYQQGFLSYPRTETDQFDNNYDLKALIDAQAHGGAPWTAYAQRLLAPESNLFRWPRSGGHDDKAHPPIHPLKPYNGGDREKEQLFEFIVRHFLACCSRDAEGQETRVIIDIAGEGFTATGLMVTQRNFLDIYRYQSWGGQGELPLFEHGQRFQPAQILLKEGHTQPPSRLTERDLISKMEEFGIGTDATVADHIQKQIERGYATKDEATMQFSPTPLGEALISAYRKMGLSNLWLPTLRGVIERNISAVAAGRRSKEGVLQEAVQAFRADFEAAQAQSHVLEQEVSAIVFGGAPPQLNANGGGGGGGGGGETFGACRDCGAQLQLVLNTEGPPSIQCSSFPMHRLRIDLPRCTSAVAVSDATCTNCTHGAVRLLDFRFRTGLLPPGFPPAMSACVVCNQQFQRLMQITQQARGVGVARAFQLISGAGMVTTCQVLHAAGSAYQRVRSAGVRLQGSQTLEWLASNSYGGDMQQAADSAGARALLAELMYDTGIEPTVGVMRSGDDWRWVDGVEAKLPGVAAVMDALRRKYPNLPSKRVWDW